MNKTTFVIGEFMHFKEDVEQKREFSLKDTTHNYFHIVCFQQQPIWEFIDKNQQKKIFFFCHFFCVSSEPNQLNNEIKTSMALYLAGFSSIILVLNCHQFGTNSHVCICGMQIKARDAWWINEDFLIIFLFDSPVLFRLWINAFFSGSITSSLKWPALI